MYLWANENHSHFCQSVFESVFSVHILQYWEFVVDWHLISAVAGTTSLALHVLQSFGSFFFLVKSKLGWKHGVFIDSFHSFMLYVLYRFSAEGKHATC